MNLQKEVEPIKNTRDINKIKQFLYGKENKRDYCIFVVGINIGLRAGDLLSLKIKDSTSVKKGDELTVNLKINLEQFEGGLEFQALSS